ncbi:MAG: tetratricopeptide repeat protein [Candidatus Lindowbacteria bacterium]|nr:tetratricopeptide repeat protein [Candidatus Lindowbacteria bacterium]
MRKFLLGVFVLLAIALPATAKPKKIALVPFENKTGFTEFDYVSDLVFNVLVTRLANEYDVRVYERSRTDILLNERSFAYSGILSESKKIAVDQVIRGSVAWDRNKNSGFITIEVTDLSAESNTSEKREEILEELSNREIIRKTRDLVKGKDALAFGWKKSDANKKPRSPGGFRVLVTGFNNYSDRSDNDELQRGVARLLEAQLGLNEKIEVVDRDLFKKVVDEYRLSKFGNQKSEKLMIIPADNVVTGCFVSSKDDFEIFARVINTHTSEIEFALSSGGAGKTNPTPEIKSVLSELSIAFGRKKSAVENDVSQGVYPASREALIYYSRGAALYEQGLYWEAVEAINRAIAVDPEYTFGKWEAARIYEEQLKDYPKAISAYEKVLADSPTLDVEEKTIFRMGMIHYRYLRNYKKALDSFLRFQKKFSGSVYSDVAHYIQGHVLQLKGEHAAAIEKYDELIEGSLFTPLAGSVLIRKGECYRELGQYKEAIAAWKQAIDEYPDMIFESEGGVKNLTVGDEAARLVNESVASGDVLQGT